MEKAQIRVVLVRHFFGLFDISSWLSAIIRFVIGYHWNHSAIFSNESGEKYVYESQSNGVVKLTFENWKKHRPNKDWIISESIFVEKIKLESKLGNKYNIPSLFEQLFYRVFGVWLGSKDDKQENCSEFVADIFGFPKAYLATPKTIGESFNFITNGTTNK